jgi:hypothetical protein
VSVTSDDAFGDRKWPAGDENCFHERWVRGGNATGSFRKPPAGNLLIIVGWGIWRGNMQRKFVDWEIKAALDKEHGLIG